MGQKDQLKAVIKQMKAAGGGSWDAEQFTAAMTQLNAPLSPADLLAAFQIIDANGNNDGRLQPADSISLLEVLYTSACCTNH